MATERVLFISSNGGGMGHLTRLLAVARRLPATHEPLFLTMSTGIDAVRREGFWVDYLPTASASKLPMETWLRYLEDRVLTAARTLAPTAIVFDGTFVYGGLLCALERLPHVYKVWSRRGMWKPLPEERARQSEKQLDAFDLVIEPGDLAAEVDMGVTVQQRDRVRSVAPVIYLDPGEILSREAARAELGIPPDVTCGLVNMGAGNINRLDVVYQAIADLLERQPDVHLVAAQSLVSQKRISIDRSRITPLETYPLSRVLGAFDFCVAAPGYNSFHELLAHGVPTLFVPNEETLTDDQRARAEWGTREGLSLTGHEQDAAVMAAQLDDLMRPATRGALRARCAALPPLDGAHQAAALLAAQREAPAAAVFDAPAAREPVGLVRFARRKLRRARRNWRDPRAALGELRELGADLRHRVLPGSAPRPRNLLLTAPTPLTDAALADLVAQATAHPGAVVLAPPDAMPALRRAGLTVELLTDSRDGYADQKLADITRAYDCAPPPSGT